MQGVNVEGRKIRILSFPYYLATKFSAFHDRGKDEPRTSKDFEDITYLLDNRMDLIEQIDQSPADVKKYLLAEFKKVIADPILKEAIFGNLYYETQEVRFEKIIEKLNFILHKQ